MSQFDDKARYEKIRREHASIMPAADVTVKKIEEASRANLLREQHLQPTTPSKLLYDQRHDHRIEKLEKDVAELKEMYGKLAEEEGFGLIKINRLRKRNLKVPIDVIVEQDDEGFLARTIDLPLYGYGDDPIDAIDSLKYEIESLYNDLMEDCEFTEEWLKIKDFLREKIIDK